MTRKGFNQSFKPVSPFRENLYPGESTGELLITHIGWDMDHASLKIRGKGCDIGWRVCIITWLGENNMYLNPGNAVPNEEGNWIAQNRIVGRQSLLKWALLYAISIQIGYLNVFYELFEESQIEGISGLEALLRKKKIPYKLASGKLEV
jgi:hypothetical protein